MEEQEARVFPDSITIIRSGKQYVFQIPSYKSKHTILKFPSKAVFVLLNNCYIDWLSELKNYVAENSTTNSVFGNQTIDKSTPGISAFRITTESANFSQVQVIHSQSKDFVLLNYFNTSHEKKPKFVVLYDIACPSKSEIIWGSTTLPCLKQARYLISIYEGLITYLRPWDYSSNRKLCTVFPFDFK